MRIVRTISELRAVLKALRENGRRIGFVPTMGCLHEGHAALIRQSAARCDHTVVSIFVNPTQFGPTEDLSNYPRELERDQALCLRLDVSVLFLPEPAEIYPTAFCTFVEPGQLGDQLCGAFRPGHFRGVATVVTKLFNMVQPDLAFFGQRDLQQTVIIRRIVRDLNLPVDIVVVPTVREPDGLALGSRNVDLGPEERARALCLSRALFAAEAAFQAGERRPDRLLDQARQHLGTLDTLQYLELVDTQSLEPLGRDVVRTSAMCLAAVIGKTRLIDNVLLAPDPDSAQFTSHLETE
jgi:pantoate--beta-alanine ligase